MLRALMAVAFLAITVTDASAVITTFRFDKGVLSGRKSLFGTSSEVDINCRFVQAKPPIILEPPEHGRVSFSRGVDYPRFNRDNPHFKCSYKKIPGVRIYYQSEPGYTGMDHFKIEDLSSVGDINDSTFDIIVR